MATKQKSSRKKKTNYKPIIVIAAVGLGIYLYTHRKKYVVTIEPLPPGTFDPIDLMQVETPAGSNVLTFDSNPENYYQQYDGQISGIPSARKITAGIPTTA